MERRARGVKAGGDAALRPGGAHARKAECSFRGCGRPMRVSLSGGSWKEGVLMAEEEGAWSCCSLLGGGLSPAARRC